MAGTFAMIGTVVNAVMALNLQESLPITHPDATQLHSEGPLVYGPVVQPAAIKKLGEAQ